MSISLFGEKHFIEGQENIVRKHIQELITKGKINVLFIEYSKVVKDKFGYNAFVQKKLDEARKSFLEEENPLQGAVEDVFDISTHGVATQSEPSLQELVCFAIENNVQVHFVDVSPEHFMEIAKKRSGFDGSHEKAIDFMVSVNGMILRNEKIAKKIIECINLDNTLEYALLIGSDHVNGVRGERYTIQKQLEVRLQGKGIQTKVYVLNETLNQIQDLAVALENDAILQGSVEKYRSEVIKTAKAKAAVVKAEERLKVANEVRQDLFGDYNYDSAETDAEVTGAIEEWKIAKAEELKLFGNYDPKEDTIVVAPTVDLVGACAAND